jgi:PAS domain S-box-containing protein
MDDSLRAAHEVILDSINEGVFTIDLDGRVTSFNRAAEQITGIDREDALGHPCSEVFRASICENACALKRTLETGRPMVDATVYIVDAAGNQIPIKISAAVLRDHEGQVIGGVETFQDLRQIEELRKQLHQRHTFEDIVGRSAVIQELFDLLPQVADSDSSVLIEGASGTGKELFARAIHNLSRRRKKRFVAVNCAALPDTLLESELFGYKKGAFTDAKRDKPGRLAVADGGTLFLDEIGDISPAMQVRLLRVLQEHTFEPLGSVNPVHTDLRVIAATNRSLSQLVQEGSFREDLYYRLNVVRLAIPGLRDRREDIPLLLDHFIATFNRLQEKDVTGVSGDVLAVLMEHDYPGNIRELRNVVEHAFVLCHSGLIQLAHLPPYLRERSIPGVTAASGLDLQSMERALIAEALRRYDGNRSRAAQALGIDPSTLYRKIQRMESSGAELPTTDGRGKRSSGQGRSS